MAFNATRSFEQVAQAAILRDTFGTPHRSPPLFAPSVLRWHDATVVRVAQAAYDNRQLPAGTLETERLMVLADALEDAGCRDLEVLMHLREPEGHYRGCWVLDLVLAKE